jgi:hypothetical protein
LISRSATTNCPFLASAGNLCKLPAFAGAGRGGEATTFTQQIVKCELWVATPVDASSGGTSLALGKFDMTLHLRTRNPIDRVARLSGAVAAVAALTLPFVAGCEDEGPVVVAEDTPPFPPDGVFSVTGDRVVSIGAQLGDSGGYVVYRSTSSRVRITARRR